ncbi:YIP1 family protein [Candidatus Woesearchaeota archaeon]|nr:YIP1 family protein [Candidatus Woesearchaeota archaeon]
MRFQKLKTLFADPVKFFKDISKEKSYWTVLKPYVLVYLAALIIQLLASIPIYYGTPVFMLSILTGLLVGIAGAFATPFIGSFFTHLGIFIVGGRKGFFNTFKALTYGTLVVVVYGVLSSIISLLLFLLKVERESGSISLMAVISIVGVMHMLVTSAIGVSMYHSISRWKAFFGIILIPLILLVIIIAFAGLALINPALV